MRAIMGFMGSHTLGHDVVLEARHRVLWDFCYSMCSFDATHHCASVAAICDQTSGDISARSKCAAGLYGEACTLAAAGGVDGGA